jgi:tRNA (cytidine/uridine-2'-O-)-methyltransferase
LGAKMDRDYGRMSFNIVLYQPEIPANTGNIARLCVGCGAQLHIIKPMRFLLTDKYVKRAGLDYWDKLDLVFHDQYEDFHKLFPSKRVFYCSTKGGKLYSEVNYTVGDTFVFGPETRGLPDDLLQRYPDQVLKIPMTDDIRSINLANSVAIVLYEAWRQTGFKIA